MKCFHVQCAAENGFSYLFRGITEAMAMQSKGNWIYFLMYTQKLQMEFN